MSAELIAMIVAIYLCGLPFAYGYRVPAFNENEAFAMAIFWPFFVAVLPFRILYLAGRWLAAKLS